MKTEMTVAGYLKSRMEELGIAYMFGVAGNYTAPLLDTILADSDSPIKIIKNSNEITAGFAADGYARVKGKPSAVYVTYSVGPFTGLNTIAGSFVEKVPILMINGAPTNKEDSNEKNVGLLYSHTTGYEFIDIHMFRPITVAAERITNAAQAPFQIDSVLTALLTHSRPVYLEVTEDVWRARCNAPEGSLSSGKGRIVTVSEANNAIEASMKLIRSRPKSIFWAGIELQRLGLQEEFLELLAVTNDQHAQPNERIHFVTSALGKSCIAEDNPYFDGCVTLTKNQINELVGDDGVIIGIGAWTVGKDTENQNIRSDRTIMAAHDGVFVGSEFFPLVDLKTFIAALTEAFKSAHKLNLKGIHPPLKRLALVDTSDKGMGYTPFFKELESYINQEKDTVLVVDAGFPLIGAQGVTIPERNGFVAQAAWLAIGYSVAAATGVKFAVPNKRVMVAVGDGAFHETCQAVAEHHANGQNTVVFVLVNGIYGIEQYLVNPNPFRKPPVDYSDKLLDANYSYNEIPRWNYSKIPDAMGGIGRKAGTVDELRTVLEEIRQTPNENFVVEVSIPSKDTPEVLWPHLTSAIGEDETENPNWPPESKF
jgi:indolepyruvate decarboxylase